MKRRSQNFYRSLDGLTGKETVAKAEVMFDKVYEHESMYAENGEYLALQVWATRRFDETRIEASIDPKD